MKNNVVSLNPTKTKKKYNEDEIPRKKKERNYDSFNLEEAFSDLGIKSFKSEYRKLSKMADSQDFVADTAVYALLRSQFAMLVNALPVIEEAVHKYRSDRAAYSLVALSNHLREIGHDLKSFGDNSQLVERIRNEVIQPLLSNLVTALVADILNSRKKLNIQLKGKEAKKVYEELKRLQESFAVTFAKAENESTERLAKILSIK